MAYIVKHPSLIHLCIIPGGDGPSGTDTVDPIGISRTTLRAGAAATAAAVRRARELGVGGIIIDRPWGNRKAPASPDGRDGAFQFDAFVAAKFDPPKAMYIDETLMYRRMLIEMPDLVEPVWRLVPFRGVYVGQVWNASNPLGPYLETLGWGLDWCSRIGATHLIADSIATAANTPGFRVFRSAVEQHGMELIFEGAIERRSWLAPTSRQYQTTEQHAWGDLALRNLSIGDILAWNGGPARNEMRGAAGPDADAKTKLFEEIVASFRYAQANSWKFACDVLSVPGLAERLVTESLELQGKPAEETGAEPVAGVKA